MQPDPSQAKELKAEANDRLRDKSTLELCFITIVGILVLSAFATALTYNYVSAIAPLCTMIPLLILIGVQFKRALKASRRDVLVSDLSQAIKGRNAVFNTAAAFIGWMVALLAMIFLVGHYLAIAVFMLVLLRVISKEHLARSIGISASITLVIYLLFEFGFNIEMYRGLVYRLS